MPKDNILSDRRPSPDALLEAARRSESGEGRLKVFVGAAPGVGKTYEMLQTAIARKRDGYDVVIGVVETHGRKDTEALLSGLEVIPRRRIEYKGQNLEEMDLEAIIARRPEIVLVDELAHSNAPGTKHPKRYLDVLDLLKEGIHVYTTVNIQHIESLNDVVAQITQVRVRETVPDSVFDRADDVKLVDLTPEDLIQRLKEGKIYLPRQAERALEHFFSPANLMALRELALRRTAERVDDQLLSQMQERAIEGPWAAGERILVCVSEDPRAPNLARYGKRLADRLHGQWTALYVESPRSLELKEDQRDRIAETLRLSQSLGGEAVTVPGGRRQIADEILQYALSNNITHIIIGKSTRSRWFELVNGSVVHDLVRRAGNISVHVIAGEMESRPVFRGPKWSDLWPSEQLSWPPYAIAGAATVFALLVGLFIKPWLGLESVDLVFLAAIVGVAIQFGLWPSVAASILSSLFYNFFFIPPLYTFTIADPRNVWAFLFFAAMAIGISNVAGRARSLAVIAIRRAKMTESLYGFSRKLTGVATLDDVLWAAAYQAALMLKVRVVLLLPENGALAVKTGYPPEDEIDSADLAAARWAWENDHPAGRGSDTLPGAKRLFIPMRTTRSRIGIIGIDSDKPGILLSPDERRLLDSLIDQTALAIERVLLVNEMDRAQRTAETERLRSALLTSLSHDLRTPLSAVIATAQTLRDMGGQFSDAQKSDLLANILDESERLNRFIANLLDMTRLESGAVLAKTSLHNVSEVVGGALRRAGKILADHKVELDLSPDLPMLELDDVLFEQALFNLLDNAAKYAPAGTTVRIIGRRVADQVRLEVLDEGDGIPPSDLEHIFDKFYRIQKGDRVRAGTGLGLAIARGFMQAMHGSVVATNRTDRTGARFVITLPVPQPGKIGEGPA